VRSTKFTFTPISLSKALAWSRSASAASARA
jgi:hypothetical protein